MQSQSNLPSINCANDGVTVVALPYHPENRGWLHGILGHRKPKWDPAKKSWTIPRAHALAIAVAAAKRWGESELVTWARLDSSVRCDTRCLEADGDDCICSCGGVHHGTKALSQGVVVGATTVLIPGDKQLIRRVFRRAP